MDLKVLGNGPGDKIRRSLIFDRQWEDDLLLLTEVTEGVLIKEGQESLRFLLEIPRPSCSSHPEIARSGKRVVVVVR